MQSSISDRAESDLWLIGRVSEPPSIIHYPLSITSYLPALMSSSEIGLRKGLSEEFGPTVSADEKLLSECTQFRRVSS